MINNSMNTDKDKNNVKNLSNDPEKKKPNETGGIYFSSHFKIFDPNTKEVLVHQRAD